MPKSTPSVAPLPKEKILFEVQALMWPTIINLENLAVIGFVGLIAIASVVFRFGLQEIIIIAVVFLLLAIPSFRNIFSAGSTTYVLTNIRLIIFRVGIGQREQIIPLDQIQSVTCKPSGLQRFYGAGDILIKQKGLRRTVRMLGLRECKRRAGQIRQAVSKATQKTD
jgi:hypothetical protein